jgi:hypothetical protein
VQLIDLSIPEPVPRRDGLAHCHSTPAFGVVRAVRPHAAQAFYLGRTIAKNIAQLDVEVEDGKQEDIMRSRDTMTYTVTGTRGWVMGQRSEVCGLPITARPAAKIRRVAFALSLAFSVLFGSMLALNPATAQTASAASTAYVNTSPCTDNWKAYLGYWNCAGFRDTNYVTYGYNKEGYVAQKVSIYGWSQVYRGTAPPTLCAVDKWEVNGTETTVSIGLPAGVSASVSNTLTTYEVNSCVNGRQQTGLTYTAAPLQFSGKSIRSIKHTTTLWFLSSQDNRWHYVTVASATHKISPY